MIAKLLQEDMDAMEAQNLVNQPETSAFEEDYVEPSNLRPPADIYEEQLIGGPSSIMPNIHP